jgi:hypothetical protein
VSCPAATGVAAPSCELHQGGEHRCGSLHDGPPKNRYVHRCDCNYRWTCLTGTVDELLASLGVR